MWIMNTELEMKEIVEPGIHIKHFNGKNKWQTIKTI